MPRHIDDAEPPITRRQRREAELDRYPAPPLLSKAIGIATGQRPDQRRLAVVNVTGGADGERS